MEAQKDNRAVLKNSQHVLPPGAKAVRRTSASRWIELTLGVKRKNDLPNLDALDYKLPGERKYMTREELADNYGSDPQALTKIQAFATKHNLVVTRSDPGSARLGVAGTVADVSEAFGVTLFDYDHPQLGQFHARTGPVQLPADVADAITGVFGLNNHRILRRGRHVAAHTADAAVKARPWFVPTELAKVYNFPDADASQECIGLLEFGGGVDQNDVQAYFQKIGAPIPNIDIVALDNVSTDPASDPQSTGEVMLDIDVAGCLSAGAKIAIYFSTFDEKGLVDCLSGVIADSKNNPSVLSVSWGWDENQPFNSNNLLWSLAAIDHVNHSFLACAHLGITVCVSTGDDGSEAQVTDGLAHVNFPASSPYVLAVGGTTLHVHRSASGQVSINEVVWNNGPGSGGSGGVSDITPVPKWQTGRVPTSINPTHFAGRAIPDVAANADPNTGYLVMTSGKLSVFGGTSASAPLWASLLVRLNALLKARTGNINALLYSEIGPAGVLRDIVSGNNDTDGLLNGKYQAGPGWDACTGWGAPDGVKLLKALQTPMV